MYKRELTQKIKEKLRTTPAVVILGPRQVGKTTLAFQIAKSLPSVYLDLENPEDFQKLKNPIDYLELHADKLVILDEIQQYLDLFASLRGIIDAGRREGKGSGHYWAIEIKAGKIPHIKKRFHIACEDLGVRRKFVIYTGKDLFSAGNETTVLSLSLFMEELRKYSNNDGLNN